MTLLLMGAGGATGGASSGITTPATTSADISAGGGTVTLPGGVLQNDVIVVLISSPNAITDITGYTLVKDGTVNNGFKLFAKRMGASPDSDFSVADNGGNQAVAVWVKRGVHTTTFEDAAATSAGSTKDPPSITTVTNNAEVGAFYCGGGGTVTGVAAPSGYTELLANDRSGSPPMCAGAWKIVAVAGAENPGAFTDGGSTFNDTITWALRPA